MQRIRIVSSVIIVALTLLRAESAWSSAAASITEEVEWTFAVRPPHLDAALPNVVLIGDSITRAYYPAVANILATKANVYLFSTTASIGDPRLITQIREFFALQHTRFRVIHFNNGMHGWAYTESVYAAGLPLLVHTLRAQNPDARLIWTSLTPVRTDSPPGPTNPRIDARNAIAQKFADEQHIPIDDQHALMSSRTTDHEDAVHFNATGSAIQAEQAAKSIAARLIGN